MLRCIAIVLGVVAFNSMTDLAAAQYVPDHRPSFAVVGDHFELDGKPIEILSGEMHAGSNEVVIFDLFHAEQDHPMLVGLGHPILNATTQDIAPHTKATNIALTK